MYDLAIIGAGAAGLEAARQALSCKLKTVLIEKDKNSFGGVCLNKGCIPTKFYLKRSQYRQASFFSLFQEKNKLVSGVKAGALKSLEKEGLDIIWSRASFADACTLTLDQGTVSARNIIIASGARPYAPFKPDGRKIIFAEDIFSFSRVPENCLIIGGGCIGLEMACLLNNLSCRVFLAEKEKSILPDFNQRAVNRLRALLERKGIKIKTGLSLAEPDFAAYDLVLLATGRKPDAAGLLPEKAGVKVDHRGMIMTDDVMMTSVPNIFACGDAASDKMYAYTAEYQARICLQAICGNKIKADYSGLPECVYTIPQLARTGISEAQALVQQEKIKVKEVYFNRFPSAHVFEDSQGYIRMLVGENQEILGATVLSVLASELISIFSLAVRNRLDLRALQNAVFLHPTLSEIIPALSRA